MISSMLLFFLAAKWRLRFLESAAHVEPNTSSYEYFPSDLYNVYRNDRAPSTNNQSYEGVLIAITK